MAYGVRVFWLLIAIFCLQFEKFHDYRYLDFYAHVADPCGQNVGYAEVQNEYFCKTI